MVRPAGGFGQAIFAGTTHDQLNGSLQTEAVSDGDIDRLHPLAGAQRRSNDLAPGYQGLPGAGLVVQRGVPSYQD